MSQTGRPECFVGSNIGALMLPAAYSLYEHCCLNERSKLHASSSSAFRNKTQWLFEHICFKMGMRQRAKYNRYTDLYDPVDRLILSLDNNTTAIWAAWLCTFKWGLGEEALSPLFFFLICIVGGGVQTGSTRHVGHLLAYCTCPGWLCGWRIWWN
jgi:hypothetical protein